MEILCLRYVEIWDMDLGAPSCSHQLAYFNCRSHSTVSNAFQHMVYIPTCVSCINWLLQMLSEKHPKIAFTHQFPGIVHTEAQVPANDAHWALKVLYDVVLQRVFKACFIDVDVSAVSLVHSFSVILDVLDVPLMMRC